MYYEQNPNSYRQNIYLSLRSNSAINYFRKNSAQHSGFDDINSIFIFRPQILDKIPFSHLTTAQVFGNFFHEPDFYPCGRLIVSSSRQDFFKSTQIIEYISQTDCANEVVVKKSIPIYDGFLDSVLLPSDDLF